MPAILTHDLFGRESLDEVRDLLGFRTDDETDAFLLGNQGPDPLFYLVIDPLMRKWSPLGNAMHAARPALLLLAMREAAAGLEGRERTLARAYVAGFACHWLLDSTVHPLVYHWQNGICDAGVEGLDERAASKVHAEIERDLDEAVLFSLTGQTVATYRPHARTLAASHEVLAAVDKVYFYVALWVYGKAIDPRTFSTAAIEFRLVQRVFDSPGGRKRAVIGTLERALGRTPFSLVCAMSHRDRADTRSAFDNREHGTWENPFTGEVSEDGFWDLWARARGRVGEVIPGLCSPDIDLAAMRELTGDLSFEGAPSAPDAPFTW